MSNTWLNGPNYPWDDVFDDRSGGFVGDKFYVHNTGQFYVYDTLAETWTRLADSPAGGWDGRTDTSLVNIGAFLYELGGNTASPTRLFRYSTVTNVWDELAPMIGIHYFARLAAANGKLYSFYGGATKLGVEEYNPATNVWVAKANAPNAKASPFTATVNNKVHLIGGLVSAGNEKKHDIYDPATDSWAFAADIERSSNNAYYGAAAAFGKYIFTLAVATDEFWVYDSVAGTWTRKLAPVFAGNPKSFAASSTLMYAQLSTSFKIYTPDVTGGGASFFDGTDGPTITPAPEPLPHNVTTQDTAGNIPLQRKLQENFESIQRQLMALDPDNQNTSNPQR